MSIIRSDKPFIPITITQKMWRSKHGKCKWNWLYLTAGICNCQLMTWCNQRVQFSENVLSVHVLSALLSLCVCVCVLLRGEAFMQLFVNHLCLDANSENNVKKRKDSSVSNVPTYCQKKPKSSYSINIYVSILIYFDMCFFFFFVKWVAPELFMVIWFYS